MPSDFASIPPANTRETILDAAERVILAAGTMECGLDAIIRESGFTKGALYHHFSGKDDLFFTVVSERLLPRAELLLDLAWIDLECSLAEILDQIFSGHSADPHTHAFRVLYQTASKPGGVNTRALCTNLWTCCHDRIVARLGSADTKQDLKVEQLARLLMMAVAGQSLLVTTPCKTHFDS